MDIKLTLDKTRFLVSEEVQLTVTLTNTGPAPVEIPDPFHSVNWQPVYTLVSPAHPQGEQITFRSASLGDTRQAPEGIAPKLVTLPPGQSLEQGVPLHEWGNLGQPGDYKISARLTWGSVSAQSAPAAFHVERLAARSVSVGVDERVPKSPGEWLEWLHEDTGKTRLYTALYNEPKIDMHGFKAFSVSSVGDAGAQAADILCPWANYGRMNEMTKWRAWREGAKLLGLALGMEAPNTLDLGLAPAGIVRPALMTRQGTLDVFVLAGGGKELLLAHFPPPKWEGPQDPARIRWRLPLNTTPSSVRCALAPESARSARHVLLVGEENNAIVISHLNAGDGGQPGALESVRIPNARCLPNSQAGLQIDDQGVAHAAVLVGRPTELDHRVFALVDVRFGPDGKLQADPAITEVCRLRVAPQATAVGYVITAGTPLRRDWVMLLEDNQVVHERQNARPQRLSAPAALPLELVPLSDAAYLLTVNPATGVAFEALH